MGACVEGMERLAQRVVVGCFINEPLACAVDKDRPGSRALVRSQEVVGLCIAVLWLELQHALHPVGMLHVAELSTSLDRHDQAVALVLWHADRTRKRAAQKGLNQRLIPLEPTGGDHDASARADAEGSGTAILSHNADYAAVRLDEFQSSLLKFYRNAAIEHGLEQ